ASVSPQAWVGPVLQKPAIDPENLGREARTLYEIDQLLRCVPGARSRPMPLSQLLELEADALIAAHGAGNPIAAHLVRGGSFREGQSGLSDADILAQKISREQAVDAMAKWHWFSGADEAAAAA